MASIVKRKNKYSVVYTYTDEKGNERQKWETFATKAEARKRKKAVEYEQDRGSFVVPQAKTVDDLLREYTQIYGVNTWALSTYETRQALIAHYISPVIGDVDLTKVTPRMIDRYYQSLLKMKPVATKYNKPRTEFLTPYTVREIHKILRNAFNQAVRWELIARNPAQNATLPKEEHTSRAIWDADTLFRAIELCDDDILSLAINLAFSCSLRMGEMLGLTWDCADISPESIESGTASVYVNKELQRVSRGALEELDGKGVILMFPAVLASTHTRLVLKEPKTATSVRKVFLPKTVAEMLVQRKKDIEELRELLGDEFVDYDLVFCSTNGRPIENRVISRGLQELIRENDLPPVVFHSLRHTSITYKLKLNGGDMKSVQGDSGHAQMKMVADVYSHVLDEDRKKNAMRFEKEFYSRTEDTGTLEEKGEPAKKETDRETILRILSNPETAALLKSLVNNI